METQPRTTHQLSPVHTVETKIPQPMSLTHCPQTFSKSRGEEMGLGKGGVGAEEHPQAQRPDSVDNGRSGSGIGLLLL